jgi:hypothetical protein
MFLGYSIEMAMRHGAPKLLEVEHTAETRANSPRSRLVEVRIGALCTIVFFVSDARFWQGDPARISLIPFCATV